MNLSKKIILITSFIFLSIPLLNASDDANGSQEQKDNSVYIIMPKVPEVPKVEAVVPKVYIIENGITRINNEELIEKEEEDEKEKHEPAFGKRVPKTIFNYQRPVCNTEVGVGEIKNERVAAYLHLPLMDENNVTQRLESAGFTILAKYKLDKKGTATSIVFSDKSIEDTAAKDKRGFASTLRVVINKQHKVVSISNPIYVFGAFMQDEYNADFALSILKRLRESFCEMQNSKEIVKFSVLKRYRFMENMPYYEDMITLGKGTNEELLAKAKKAKAIIYEQHLSNGSIVLGIKLGRRTNKFVKKIGFTNGGLLPYPVLIEKGEAKMLDPKYYIAMMYPMLKMSEFMTIATVPGAIQRDCDKIFR